MEDEMSYVGHDQAYVSTIKCRQQLGTVNTVKHCMDPPAFCNESFTSKEQRDTNIAISMKCQK